MQAFSNRIKELRDEYGFDQNDLAKRLNVSKSTISKYENGVMQPSLDMMLKIKQEFGKSLDWQMGCDDNTENKYSSVIKECEKANIPLEKLHEIINILKR